MSVYRKKVFPLRLPQNFHGQSSRKQSLKELYKQKASSTAQPNPQTPRQKIVNWQLKKKNSDIINERRQFLTHTGKISHDTPTWFQSTSDFYRKVQLQKLRQKQLPNESKKYDVFNRRRFSLSEYKSSQLDQNMDERLRTKRNSMMQKSCSWNITDKIGHEKQTSYSTFKYNRSEVTPKIGSVDVRDYSIKKPQMKIGKNTFIDTYSPF